MSARWPVPLARDASLSDQYVVVVTHSSWHEPPRIRHQIARQLSRFTHVYYVETPTEWRYVTRTTTEQVTPSITRVVLGNPHRIPRRIHRWFDPLWTKLNTYYLREIDALPGLDDDPILMTFNFDFVEAIKSGRFALTSYFCNDVFTTFATDRRARRAIALREEATARASDLCLTVSTVLANDLSRWNPRTSVVLPGHELPEKRPAPRRGGALRIGYMGYLDRRLHYDWLLAAAHSGIDVHLIGPVAVPSKPLTLLLNAPNVTWHGPRQGNDMQNILLDLDALVLPYSTEGTGMLPMTAPNKLYTYLACEKPIVVSDLPNLVKFEHGLLYRATTADEFLSAILAASNEDSDALRDRRRAIANANTWDKRGDELRVLLERELARKKG